MHSSPELTLTSATLTGSNLFVFLSDGRIVIYPIAGMTWITEASQEKQQDFEVTEWEIYWNQIDDGLTLERILSPKPRIDFVFEKAPNWEQFQAALTTHQGEQESISSEKVTYPSAESEEKRSKPSPMAVREDEPK